ncbi:MULTISPECIES: hypothetical protein [unclassified Rummeliibacillus]|uniref:hypothetical protein n=1 Tax=unclassified Rummeliibacillus TaxID=2622809 RepID=UPI0013DD9EFE|nr:MULTISPECIES: hypothetical protein [unclassified Rummeliibacillus]
MSKSKEKKYGNGSTFNGTGFTNAIILIVLLFMLIFGSTDIATLSEVEIEV